MYEKRTFDNLYFYENPQWCFAANFQILWNRIDSSQNFLWDDLEWNSSFWKNPEKFQNGLWQLLTSFNFTAVSKLLEGVKSIFCTCLKTQKNGSKTRVPCDRIWRFSVHFKSFRMKFILFATSLKRENPTRKHRFPEARFSTFSLLSKSNHLKWNTFCSYTSEKRKTAWKYRSRKIHTNTKVAKMHFSKAHFQTVRLSKISA